ncbi:MAG: transposase DNA-binding-containing protein [Shewanella sp.]
MLKDARRTERLISTCANMASRSGKSIANVCHGNEAEPEGSYKLIRNNKISPEMIRAAGSMHTASLVEDVPEILALEDTMARMISVCDRGADILSYLQDKQQPKLGSYTINIPQKGMINSKRKPVNRASREVTATARSNELIVILKNERAYR